jgi:hypothetical protein
MKFILLSLLSFTAFLRAELVFDALKKEIKAGPDARQIICDFYFENKGDKTVSIASYESTCSCMAVMVNQEGKLDYAPGEKGVMRATFDMENFTGEVDKNVLIWMKGDPEAKPSIILVVNVIIPVLVDIQPRTLEWSGPAPWEKKSIKVEMNHSEPIKILRASIGNPMFESEVKTITEGKSYEVIVTPLAKPDAPPGMAVIHIETDCKIDKQKKQMAFAVVRPDIVKPSPAPAPQLGPAPQGEEEKATTKQP